MPFASVAASRSTLWLTRRFISTASGCELKIGSRISAQGAYLPKAIWCPGTRQLLELLVSRGLRLYLASGTDDANVKEEAALLDVSRYFEDRIFGAQDDLKSFSKALLVQQILSRAAFQAEELLVFGDGYVEIEEVKKVGGIAVGVATDEPLCLSIDPWKRQRLQNVGADFIVPNYLEIEQLTTVLFDNPVLVS